MPGRDDALLLGQTPILESKGDYQPYRIRQHSATTKRYTNKMERKRRNPPQVIYDFRSINHAANCAATQNKSPAAGVDVLNKTFLFYIN